MSTMLRILIIVCVVGIARSIHVSPKFIRKTSINGTDDNTKWNITVPAGEAANNLSKHHQNITQVSKESDNVAKFTQHDSIGEEIVRRLRRRRELSSITEKYQTVADNNNDNSEKTTSSNAQTANNVATSSTNYNSVAPSVTQSISTKNSETSNDKSMTLTNSATESVETVTKPNNKDKDIVVTDKTKSSSDDNGITQNSKETTSNSDEKSVASNTDSSEPKVTNSGENTNNAEVTNNNLENKDQKSSDKTEESVKETAVTTINTETLTTIDTNVKNTGNPHTETTENTEDKEPDTVSSSSDQVIQMGSSTVASVFVNISEYINSSILFDNRFPGSQKNNLTTPSLSTLTPKTLQQTFQETNLTQPLHREEHLNINTSHHPPPTLPSLTSEEQPTSETLNLTQIALATTPGMRISRITVSGQNSAVPYFNSSLETTTNHPSATLLETVPITPPTTTLPLDLKEEFVQSTLTSSGQGMTISPGLHQGWTILDPNLDQDSTGTRNMDREINSTQRIVTTTNPELNQTFQNLEITPGMNPALNQTNLFMNTAAIQNHNESTTIFKPKSTSTETSLPLSRITRIYNNYTKIHVTDAISLNTFVKKDTVATIFDNKNQTISIPITQNVSLENISMTSYTVVPIHTMSKPLFVDITTNKVCTYQDGFSFNISMFNSVTFTRVDCPMDIAVFDNVVAVDSGLSASVFLTIYKRLRLFTKMPRLIEELNEYVYTCADLI